MNEMSAKFQHAELFNGGGSAHFLVEFDILDNFESKSEVAKQNVYAQEPNETKIAQHMI
jgi:hypothetical protein